MQYQAERPSAAPIGSAAIIGAGIGGLTAALALARAGIEVTLHEQADELREVGAGITISPNSDRVLCHLGLGQSLHALAYVPERQVTQHWQSGEVLRMVERGPDIARRYGAGYYHLHRADLVQVLAEAVAAQPCAKVRLGQKLVGCTAQGELSFADGTTSTAELVIGADGLKSAVRDALFDSARPEFTGQVAWRGVVPIERLAPHSPLRNPGIHIGPQRLVARYPIRAGRLINYAAFVELDSWREEGWMIRSSASELIGHFAGADPDLLALFDATPADQIFKWALFAREPLETWVAGRVTLLGDAAHPMLPFMGQGAGTAIEDAMVLARALAAMPLDEALRAYAAERQGRTAMVQLNSRLMGHKFQSKTPERFGVTPVRDEEALGLFAYDAVRTPLG